MPVEWGVPLLSKGSLSFEIQVELEMYASAHTNSPYSFLDSMCQYFLIKHQILSVDSPSNSTKPGLLQESEVM